eukprot:Pompholyxophrys_punicea_v1_NODE_186_length_2908_cov_28.244304.p2 type:complete len:130 gc:universal NODE_186_length_2908_cov_28.244304:386-775(+)
MLTKLFLKLGRMLEKLQLRSQKFLVAISKEKVRRFLSTLKIKWNKAKRVRDRFEKINAEWLKVAGNFVSADGLNSNFSEFQGPSKPLLPKSSGRKPVDLRSASRRTLEIKSRQLREMLKNSPQKIVEFA